jgi:hypothetical protein
MAPTGRRSKGEYPALDERRQRWHKAIRQAGVLLICAIAIFANGHNGTRKRGERSRIAETEISNLSSLEKVTIFNAPIHIDGSDSRPDVGNFICGESATEPQSLIYHSSCANCRSREFLEYGDNQFFFVSGIDYCYLRPTDNVISWGLAKVLNSEPDARHVGPRWIGRRQHHATQYPGNIGENIRAQFGARSDYLPIAYQNQTAGDNREENGRYGGYGSVVVLQEGTNTSNEILQTRYFLSGIIFIVGAIIALLLVVYFWWR